MVTSMRLAGRFAVAVFLAGCRVAQASAPAVDRVPAGTDAPDSALVADMGPELLEALAELDAADQPVAVRDVAVSAARRAVAASSTHGDHARLRWRVQAGGDELRHDGRIEWGGGPAGGRVAWRLRGDRRPDVSGGGWWQVGVCRLWAGQLTLRHGYGLVAPDPARRSALTADQSLSGTTGGLAVRLAPARAGFTPQAGWEAGARHWRLSALWDPSGPLAVRATRVGSVLEWGLLASRDTSRTAVSCSGRLARAASACSWEVAASRAPGGSPSVAMIAGAHWLATRAVRVEVQSGLADGPWPESAGVLPAAARAGWALRAAWRDRGAGSLELLLQGARLRPELATTTRRLSRVAELAWVAHPRPGLTCEGRLRRALRSDATWSARQPWEPADEVIAGVRTAASAAATWDLAGTSAAVQWRAFTVDAPAGPGTRQLATLSWRRTLRPGWSAWAETSTAWGDPVDLVRGSAPLPGVVAPRHWGRWRAEVMAGTRLDRGRCRLGVAAAHRQAEAGGADGWDAWLEAGASW